MYTGTHQPLFGERGMMRAALAVDEIPPNPEARQRESSRLDKLPPNVSDSYYLTTCVASLHAEKQTISASCERLVSTQPRPVAREVNTRL